MEPDDLLTSPDDPWSRPELRTQLVDDLRRATTAAVADVDAAEALAQLLQSDFMAYGTGGGERLTGPEARLALRSLRAVAVAARLDIAVEVPWRDFDSFRAHWLSNDGYGSWAARRQMVAKAFDPFLTRIYALHDLGPSGEIALPAMDALPSSEAIKEHLKRLAMAVDSDPRLAVSVSKDLVESTAKLILRERDVTYKERDDLPALVSRAQTALSLHAAGVAGPSVEAQALKTILGSAHATHPRSYRTAQPSWGGPRTGIRARMGAAAARAACSRSGNNVVQPYARDPGGP